VQLEELDYSDHLVLWDLLVLLDHWDCLVQWEEQEIQDLRDLPDLTDHRALQVQRGRLEERVLLVSPEVTETLVLLEFLDHLETPGRQDRLDFKVRPEHLDLKEPLVQLEIPARPVSRVLPEH